MLARGANIARSRWEAGSVDLRRYVNADGESLVAAGRGRGVAASLMKGGSSSADRVMGRLLETDGAVWRRTKAGFQPANAPIQDAVTGAAEAAEQVASAGTEAASNPARGLARGILSRVSALHVPRAAVVAAGVGASLLVAGMARSLLGAATGSGPSLPGSSSTAGSERTGSTSATRDPAARRANAAKLAEDQLDVVDTTSDHQLDDHVRDYIGSSSGVEPTRTTDWTGDMVGWIWKQAGVPLGAGGVGAHDVTDLVMWARDNDIWADSSPAYDPKHPNAEVGTVLVLQGDHNRTLDLGVVVRADQDELELVMGNRATGTKVGGSQVGAVRRVIVSRHDPLVAGLIDPTQLKAAPTTAPSPSAPSSPSTAPTPTAPSTTHGSKPKHHGAPTVSPDALRRVAPWLSSAQAEVLGTTLGEAFAKNGIDTPQRAAMAVAQLAHESMGFRTTQELGDDAYFTEHYENRASLGNTQPGDGARFHGRGYIQVTGRTNYEAISKALHVDFVHHPDKLATPKYAAMASALWWKTHGCNQLADSGDFTALTERINGGTNGLEARLAYYERAKHVAKDLVPQ
jgi:putative chitinase